MASQHSNCKHCGQPIVSLVGNYTHVMTGFPWCETTFATPLEE